MITTVKFLVPCFVLQPSQWPSCVCLKGLCAKLRTRVDYCFQRCSPSIFDLFLCAAVFRFSSSEAPHIGTSKELPAPNLSSKTWRTWSALSVQSTNTWVLWNVSVWCTSLLPRSLKWNAREAPRLCSVWTKRDFGSVLSKSPQNLFRPMGAENSVSVDILHKDGARRQEVKF